MIFRVIAILLLCLGGGGEAMAQCAGASGLPFNCNQGDTPQPGDYILGGATSGRLANKTVRWTLSQIVGTSGHALPYLDGANTWSRTQTFAGAGNGIIVTNNAVIGGSLTSGGPVRISAALPISGTVSEVFRLDTSVFGTVSGGDANWVSFVVDNDSADTTNATGGGANGFLFAHALSPGAIGSRTALGFSFNQLGITTAGVGQYYVGFGGLSQAAYSAGGIAGAGNARGNLFGANVITNLKTGAGLYWNSNVGYEIDVTVQSGVAVNLKIGMKVVQGSTDAVRGGQADYGYGLNNQSSGTAPGWTVGLAFGGPEGWWPIASNGTMIGTYAATIGGGPAMAADYGIKFDSVTFTTAFLKSLNFLVDGSGNATALTYKVGSNQVVGARQTGWTAPTGTLSRATFDQSTVTLAVLAQHVAAMQTDLTTHGMIGP